MIEEEFSSKEAALLNRIELLEAKIVNMSKMINDDLTTESFNVDDLRMRVGTDDWIKMLEDLNSPIEGEMEENITDR